MDPPRQPVLGCHRLEITWPCEVNDGRHGRRCKVCGASGADAVCTLGLKCTLH